MFYIIHKIKVGGLLLTQQRLKQVIYTLLNTSTAPTIASIFLALMVFIYGEQNDMFAELIDSFPKRFSLILFIFILLGLWSSYRLFSKMPSTEYAKVSLSGVSPQKVLVLISFEIWKICWKFNNLSSLSYLNEKAKLKGGLISCSSNEKRKIERSLKIITKNFEKQQRILQNVYHMKKIASGQLNIPQRRLCDYVFDFSPLIYSHRTKKIEQNWREIILLLKIVRSENPEDRIIIEKRIKNLCNSLINIYNSISKREKRQKELISNFDILHYVHDFSSELSSSTSLRNYADAISYVCKNFVNDLSLEGNKKEIDKAKNRLKFLYYKRLTYPGFDLHSFSINFCDKMTKRKNNDMKLLKQSLERIAILNSGNVGFNENHLDALGRFYTEFEKEVELSRQGIYLEFRKRLKIIRNAEGAKEILIATHHFSKNVREIIRGISDDLSQRLKDTNFYLYLLHDKVQEDDLFKTRLFRYELIEGGHIGKNARTRKNIQVLAGDAEFLLRICRQKMKIIFLLGGECFDLNKKAFHTAGLKEDLLKLKKEINEITTPVICESYIAGEPFKLFEDLSNEPGLKQEHSEDIHFYDNGYIDKIIYGFNKVIE